LGQADTWLSDTTFEENNRAERQAYRNLRQQIYIGRVHLSRHTRTILSEQLDDVDDSDDDSSETYDVEEVMAVATINEASLTTECLEYV